MHSIIESTNCGGPSAWSLESLEKSIHFIIGVRHKLPAMDRSETQVAFDETVRHIFVFCSFTFSGKVKCHFKC